MEVSALDLENMNMKLKKLIAQGAKIKASELNNIGIGSKKILQHH